MYWFFYQHAVVDPLLQYLTIYWSARFSFSLKTYTYKITLVVFVHCFFFVKIKL